VDANETGLRGDPEEEDIPFVQVAGFRAEGLAVEAGSIGRTEVDDLVTGRGPAELAMTGRDGVLLYDDGIARDPSQSDRCGIEQKMPRRGAG
jgi:hypothetical protein